MADDDITQKDKEAQEQDRLAREGEANAAEA